jgi:hypothetical protein
MRCISFLHSKNRPSRSCCSCTSFKLWPLENTFSAPERITTTFASDLLISSSLTFSLSINPLDSALRKEKSSSVTVTTRLWLWILRLGCVAVVDRFRTAWRYFREHGRELIRFFIILCEWKHSCRLAKFLRRLLRIFRGAPCINAIRVLYVCK